MAYNITIKYFGVEKSADKIVAPICSIFEPTGSYVDTDVFTKGLVDSHGKVVYGKSVYATNDHSSIAELAAPSSYHGGVVPLSVPLAQFDLAVVGEEFTESNRTGRKVSFTVEDYAEMLYYKQIGASLAEQGFEVVVEDAASKASV